MTDDWWCDAYNILEYQSDQRIIMKSLWIQLGMEQFV